MPVTRKLSHPDSFAGVTERTREVGVRSKAATCDRSYDRWKPFPMHDEKLATLVPEVADELPLVYVQAARVNVSELFHLQPATNRVVERLAATWRPTPSLVGKKFGDTLGRIGLDNVDAVFNCLQLARWQPYVPRAEVRAGLERMRLGRREELASGVLNRNAEAGYMLAGSPTSQRRRLGRAIRPKACRPPSLLVNAHSWIGSPSSSRPEPITPGPRSRTSSPSPADGPRVTTASLTNRRSR